jgi:hypothetical protein
MGASALALDEHLDGDRPRLGACLRAALGRGVSLAVAGSLVFVVNTLLATVFFANVWLGWFMLCAVPLCARRDATGLGALNASRRVLAGLGGKAAALNVLYLLLLLLVWLNVVLGVHILLVIAHALFDVDVAWMQRFLSPASPIFGVLSVGLAITVLEPVRHLTCALLVWDARIRREAHDIRAVFAELARSAPARGAGTLGALALALLLGAAGVARAEPTGGLGLVGGETPAAAVSTDDLGQRLAALHDEAQRLGGTEAKRADVKALREQVDGLAPAERAKLGRFLDEADAESRRLARLPDHDTRRREAGRLAARSAEVVEAVGRLGGQPAVRDARTVARDVLAQPEFRRAPVPATQPEGESWWDRLLKRLFKPREVSAGPRVGAPGIGGGFFQALTILLLAAGATLIVVQVVRWLLGRRREDADGRPGLPDLARAGAEPLPDPTKRTAAEWLADADAAAAQGEFRGAVRNLYLALLSALCRRGVLRYDPARTNGEYVRSFRGATDDRAAFRAVTLLSDAVLYSELAVGSPQYQGARGLAVRLAGDGDGDRP